MPERKQLHRNQLFRPARRIGDVHGKFERPENETHDGLGLRKLGRRGDDENRRTEKRYRGFHFVFRMIVFGHVRIGLLRVFEKPERLVPELLLNEIFDDFVPFVRPFVTGPRAGRSVYERQIPIVGVFRRVHYVGTIVRNLGHDRIRYRGYRRKIRQRENHRSGRAVLLYRRSRSETGANAALPQKHGRGRRFYEWGRFWKMDHVQSRNQMVSVSLQGRKQPVRGRIDVRGWKNESVGNGGNRNRIAEFLNGGGVVDRAGPDGRILSRNGGSKFGKYEFERCRKFRFP